MTKPFTFLHGGKGTRPAENDRPTNAKKPRTIHAAPLYERLMNFSLFISGR